MHTPGPDPDQELQRGEAVCVLTLLPGDPVTVQVRGAPVYLPAQVGAPGPCEAAARLPIFQ